MRLTAKIKLQPTPEQHAALLKTLETATAACNDISQQAWESKAFPLCGCIDKRNRPSQSTFSCVSCGFSAPADTVAAWNIRARAVVNLTGVGLPALAGSR